MSERPADDPEAVHQGSLSAVEEKTFRTPMRSSVAEKGLERAVGVIEARMDAADIADLPALTKILGNVIDLQERQRDAENARLVQRWSIIGRYGISAVALIAGSSLAAIGVGLPAFFLIGGGLYGIVPQYVADFMKRFVGNE